MIDLSVLLKILFLLFAVFLLYHCEQEQSNGIRGTDLLARRHMAREVEFLIQEAMKKGEWASALSGYELLLQCWPDFPEAGIGRRWREEQRALQNKMHHLQALKRLRYRGLKLQQNLERDKQRLKLWEWNISNIEARIWSRRLAFQAWLGSWYGSLP